MEESELAEVYVYMQCTMDGIATGDFLNEVGEDSKIYAEREYSFGSKVILVGRPTMEDTIPKGEIDLSKYLKELKLIEMIM